MTTIINDWITLNVLKNGIQVQRKFAGLDTKINEIDNSVEYCYIKYFQRELYPNGEVIKTEEKCYSLEDLPEFINNEDNWKMDSLPVLTGFINTLGYTGIIDPARETLENYEILPVNVENIYPLKRDTRDKIIL